MLCTGMPDPLGPHGDQPTDFSPAQNTLRCARKAPPQSHLDNQCGATLSALPIPFVCSPTTCAAAPLSNGAIEVEATQPRGAGTHASLSHLPVGNVHPNPYHHPYHEQGALPGRYSVAHSTIANSDDFHSCYDRSSIVSITHEALLKKRRK